MVSATCPVLKEPNTQETVGLAFITAKSSGLFVLLAALPHAAKKFPGCGKAVSRTTAPYGYSGAMGSIITEPFPATVVPRLVPKSVCAHKSRVTRSVFVGLVPLASPSHCRNVQPGSGVAVNITSALFE